MRLARARDDGCEKTGEQPDDPKPAPAGPLEPEQAAYPPMCPNLADGLQVGAAIAEAEKKFGRVQGWRNIEKPVTALSELQVKKEAATERVAQDQQSSRRS